MTTRNNLSFKSHQGNTILEDKNRKLHSEVTLEENHLTCLTCLLKPHINFNWAEEYIVTQNNNHGSLTYELHIVVRTACNCCIKSDLKKIQASPLRIHKNCLKLSLSLVIRLCADVHVLSNLLCHPVRYKATLECNVCQIIPICILFYATISYVQIFFVSPICGNRKHGTKTHKAKWGLTSWR